MRFLFFGKKDQDKTEAPAEGANPVPVTLDPAPAAAPLDSLPPVPALDNNAVPQPVTEPMGTSSQPAPVDQTAVVQPAVTEPAPTPVVPETTGVTPDLSVTPEPAPAAPVMDPPTSPETAPAPADPTEPVQ